MAVVSAATLLCATSNAAAQSAPPPSTVHFSIKAGLNLATMNVDDDGSIGLGDRVGLSGGFSATLDLSRMIAVQAEILYMQKGASVEFQGESLGSLEFDYLVIPILAQFSLSDAGGLKPFAAVGAGLGLLLSAKVDGEDVKDEASAVDVGLIVGAGVNYPLSATAAATFELRYELGLANVADENNGTITNRVLSLLIGYQF